MSDLQMSKDVAAALIEVRKAIKRLPKNSENTFAGYDFVSVDAFYDAIGPLLCDAKLSVLSDCVSDGELILTGEKSDKYGNVKKLFQLKERWAFWFVHENGAMAGPYHRNVTVPAEGAQAHGSSESYATKQFLRGQFKIVTGDKDDPDFKRPETQTYTPQKPKPASPHAITYGSGESVENEDLVQLGREVYAAISAAQSSEDVDAWLKYNEDGLTLLSHADEKAYKSVQNHANKRKEALNK